MHFLLYLSLLALISFEVKGIPSQRDGLFLTPLIKAGDLEKARELALVNHELVGISGVDFQSYAGYFTVDEATHSNLFCGFYPAKENPESAPLILWINSIPGYSITREVLLEIGPLGIGEDGRIVVKNESWTETQSILFCDTPVGTGFSFANSERDYANSAGEEAVQLYEALRQFFTLFPEFQNTDLFLAGENCAASEIPVLIEQIEMGNSNQSLKMNLKGAIVGSPYLIRSQINHGPTLLDMGLIDENQKKLFDEADHAIHNLIDNGQYKEALQRYLEDTYGPNSLFAKTTGFLSFTNALKSELDPKLAFYESFVRSRVFQELSHVGTHKFVDMNIAVMDHLANDFESDHDRIWEELLNKGYRVLIYAPQFNIDTPMKDVTRIVNNLQWKGTKGFAVAPRKIWRVNGEVAGYIKNVDNFYYAIVRNAGNSAILDQPTWMLDLVKRFLSSDEF